MAITPAKGYIVDPNNPNAVIKDTSSAMPGSVAAINQSQPSISYGAINSNSIAPTPQVNLPTPPAKDYSAGAILAGGNAEVKSFTTPSGVKVDAQGNTVETPKAETKSIAGSMADIFQKYFPTAPKSGVDQYNTLTTQAGIDEKTTAFNEANQILQALNAQLEGINSQAALLQTQAGAGGAIENQLQVDSEGRGRTSGGLAPLRADEIRKNNIKLNSLAVQALPLQAQILAQQAVVSGNKAILDSAQKKVDTLFGIYQTDVENDYNYRTDVYNSIKDIVSKEEAKILEEKKTQDARDFQIMRDQIGYAQDLAKTAIENGQSSLAGQLMSLNPNDPGYMLTLGSFAQQIGQTGGVRTPSEYAGVISTILGSGKFTKDQANAVARAINNGEDPVTVIKNQAKAILGTEGKDLTKFESAKSAMNQLDSELKQFYANGGKSGIFSGNFEKTLNNLGKVNDPRLVDISVQIAASLQKYRNAISGTAYSEQEGKDIAAIFPGITKGEILNNTIVQARLKTLDSDIDSLYSQAIGTNAYSKIKAGSATQTGKGNLTDSQFVEKAVTNSGQNYNSIISGAQKGEIAVVDNATGQIGYITTEEFNSSKYTKL